MVKHFNIRLDDLRYTVIMYTSLHQIIFSSFNIPRSHILSLGVQVTHLMFFITLRSSSTPLLPHSLLLLPLSFISPLSCYPHLHPQSLLLSFITSLRFFSQQCSSSSSPSSLLRQLSQLMVQHTCQIGRRLGCVVAGESLK